MTATFAADGSSATNGQRPLTREAAGIALRRLAATLTEQDPEAAAGRFLERVAASAPELREALVEVGARAIIGELKRRQHQDQNGACQPCDRCGDCTAHGLEAAVGRAHECRR